MPKMISLTAPSGAGKTSIAREVLKAFPEVKFSVSATTRPRRPDEQHGVHYYFVTEKQFRQFIDSGALIEYEEVYDGRFYGTLRSEVERVAENNPVLLDVDVQGALHVKQLYGDDALTLFIKPPSMEELARRLRDRNTEPDDVLRERLERAEYELSFADRFDAVVVNDDLECAVRETLDLIREFLEE